MKKLTTFAATGAIAFTMIASGAAATPGNGNANGAGNGNGGSSAAAKQCAAEKKADREAFNALYGEHAMRDCIRAHRTTDAPTVAEFKNAAKECKAERTADPVAFATTYGTNENGKNALGNCVSTKTQEA